MRRIRGLSKKDMYVCMCVCVCVYISVYNYRYACMDVYVYMYIYRLDTPPMTDQKDQTKQKTKEQNSSGILSGSLFFWCLVSSFIVGVGRLRSCRRFR